MALTAPDTRRPAGVSFSSSPQFCRVSAQGRAQKPKGPRLRGASGVNIFQSKNLFRKMGATVAAPLVSGCRSRAASRLARRSYRRPLCYRARVRRAQAGRDADQAQRDGAPALSRRAAPSCGEFERVVAVVVANRDKLRQSSPNRDNRDKARYSTPTAAPSDRRCQRTTRRPGHSLRGFRHAAPGISAPCVSVLYPEKTKVTMRPQISDL